MQTINGFNFFPLHFDDKGTLASQAELDAFCAGAQTATDAILIAHGFRNSEADATGLYTEFLATLGPNLARAEFHPTIAGRTFVVGGVFWPSLAFNETPPGPASDEGGVRSIGDSADPLAGLKERLLDMKATLAKVEDQPTLDQAIALLPTLEDDVDAQDRFVKLVLSIIDQTQIEPMEGLDRIKTTEGSTVLDNAGAIAKASADAQSENEGGVQGLGSFFGGIAAKVGQFLNFTTWYVMKARSGTVGATGVAAAVRGLHAKAPSVKIHLIGHSLGGRLMAGCAKTLSQNPVTQCDSVALLEAAFSHYGFSPDNGRGNVGFFREVMDGHVVKGPLVATFSAQDTVVGQVYALASRLAGDNTKDLGDANDQFGGIGRNGALKLPPDETTFEPLHVAGAAYARFESKKIVSLDGSNGFIKDHGDIKNADVTYLVATALSLT